MERDQLISYISDTYKEAHGIRPRHIRFDELSCTELLALYERVCEEARIERDAEQVREAEAAAKFENLLLDLIVSGAGNRQTAIRWLVEAIADKWHPAHLPGAFCFEHGLPYKYEAEVKAAINQ